MRSNAPLASLKSSAAGEAEVSAFLGSVSEGIHAAETAVSSLPVSSKPVTLNLKKTGITASKPTATPGMYHLGID